MTHTTKHTPGPWSIDAVRNETEKLSIVDADMCFVADVWQTYVNGKSRQQDNAHLIAAAPAMYEALKDLIGDLGDLHGGSIAELQCHWCGRDYEDEEAGGLCTSDDCPGYIARQAIAQAEGRQG